MDAFKGHNLFSWLIDLSYFMSLWNDGYFFIDDNNLVVKFNSHLSHLLIYICMTVRSLSFTPIVHLRVCCFYFWNLVVFCMCRMYIILCSHHPGSSFGGKKEAGLTCCDAKLSGPVPQGSIPSTHFCHFLRLLFSTALIQIYLTNAFITHVSSPF